MYNRMGDTLYHLKTCTYSCSIMLTKYPLLFNHTFTQPSNVQLNGDTLYHTKTSRIDSIDSTSPMPLTSHLSNMSDDKGMGNAESLESN